MGTWRWRRFAGCDDACADLLADWPARGAPATAELLKKGCVWAVGDVVIKTGSAARLRRSAAAWARLQPIPSPEPLMLGTSGARGILAMRRCPGVPLDGVWHDPVVRDAVSDLIAALLRRRIIHGDLSPQNLLWDGTRVWLIDLDGLRPRLHGLVWRRHLVLSWAWILYRLPSTELVRAAHQRCCETLGLGGTERRWKAVLTAERAIRAESQRRHPERKPRAPLAK